MKIAQLRSALKLLPKVDGAWSTEEGRTALTALDQLLAGAEERTIIDFCSAVKISKPKRTPKPKPVPQANTQLVADYVAELRKATTNPSSFANVMQRIKRDKSVRLPEARAIATAFAGTTSAKTKRDAFKDIEQRRAADVRSSIKREHISDIF